MSMVAASSCLARLRRPRTHPWTCNSRRLLYEWVEFMRGNVGVAKYTASDQALVMVYSRTDKRQTPGVAEFVEEVVDSWQNRTGISLKISAFGPAAEREFAALTVPEQIREFSNTAMYAGANLQN